MTFIVALEALKQEKKVRRQSWNNDLYVIMGYYHKIEIKCTRKDAVYCDLFNISDFEADDWEVVE